MTAKMNLVFSLLNQAVNEEIENDDLYCDSFIDLFYKAMQESTKENLIEIIWAMYHHISFNSDEITYLLEDLQDADIICLESEDEE